MFRNVDSHVVLPHDFLLKRWGRRSGSCCRPVISIYKCCRALSVTASACLAVNVWDSVSKAWVEESRSFDELC
jgi:hypothetical protein